MPARFRLQRPPAPVDTDARGMRSVRVDSGFVCSLTLAVLATATGCGSNVDDTLCGERGCDFTDAEWSALSALANLPALPPADPSNKQVGVPAAEVLGQKLFFDP